MVAALKTPEILSLDEFLRWNPPFGGPWQLIEGVPVAMAPSNGTHAIIQSRLTILIGRHLDRHRPACRVLDNRGVVPRGRGEANFRIPDLGVTCSPPSRDAQFTQAPIPLIEILSPSNAADTWGNVWTYTTIPSVTEILVVHTEVMRASLMRRGAVGAWSARSEAIEAGTVRLDGIGLSFDLAKPMPAPGWRGRPDRAAP